MKRDLTELKKITFDLMNNNTGVKTDFFNEINEKNTSNITPNKEERIIDVAATVSLAGQEKNLIKQSLEKHKGKRKLAAAELGISERTLYRKIKEFKLQ